MCDVIYGRASSSLVSIIFRPKRLIFRFLLFFLSETKVLAPIIEFGPFQGRVERSNHKGGRRWERSLLQLLCVRALSVVRNNRFDRIRSATT